MVTAVTGASLSFLTGHPKKQDKTPATTGTPAGTVGADTTGTSDSSATSPPTSGTTGASGTTGTYSAIAPNARPPSHGAAEPADIGAAAPPAAIHASTSAAASRAAEDARGGTQAPRLGAVPETAENRVPNVPMTPHLREMIAQLKSPLPIPAGLHRFMTDFDRDFDMLTVSRPLPQASR